MKSPASAAGFAAGTGAAAERSGTDSFGPYRRSWEPLGWVATDTDAINTLRCGGWIVPP
jgi:hypothetical protein